MARTKSVRKVSVRLTEELAEKLSSWTKSGLTLSDTVRHAISILPDSPAQCRESNPVVEVKHPARQLDRTQFRDETDALKKLQEW